jgi:lipid II:glycine glycyltransferase (peptidoglycan interpeptide bridge formation enzyme)
MIKEITDKKTWNDFVLDLKPNTFLQTWEWGQVQKQDGEDVRYAGVFEGDTQIGAALIVIVHARRGRFLLCPHGPLFVKTVDISKYFPELIDYCRALAKQEHAVALRVAPLLETKEENRKLFEQHGFRPAPIHIHAELTWVLDITPPEEHLLQDMRKTTRHAIKKAIKEGITVTVSTSAADIETFWPLYTATRSRHQFVPFSKQFLRTQVEQFGAENRMYMTFAHYKGKCVGAAILMHVGGTVFYHHGASEKLPSSLPAMQLLQWESIKEARRRGAARYNFWGIAPDDEPNHPFAGITVFKKGFGGYAIDYMHAQDLPLALGYWKLWTVEILRKYRRGFLNKRRAVPGSAVCFLYW